MFLLKTKNIVFWIVRKNALSSLWMTFIFIMNLGADFNNFVYMSEPKQNGRNVCNNVVEVSNWMEVFPSFQKFFCSKTKHYTRASKPVSFYVVPIPQVWSVEPNKFMRKSCDSGSMRISDYNNFFVFLCFPIMCIYDPVYEWGTLFKDIFINLFDIFVRLP